MALTSNPVTVKGRRSRQRTIAKHRSSLPTMAEMIARIEAVLWDMSSDEDFEAGLAWYRVGHDIGVMIGDGNADVGCGIIAALSPQEGWDSNIDKAQTMAETGKAGHTELCVSRARAIRNGQAPRDVLGGQKVRSFYLNLRHPEKNGPVTVDRHAVSIVFGRALYGSELRILERPGTYEVIASAYRAVARRHNLLAHQVQAITWVTWRKRHAPDVEKF